MAALQFPCTIFKTQKWMDDYGASDMRCGDLTEAQLKTYYHLDKVSDNVNPWTLTKVNKSRPFQHPRLSTYAYLSEGTKITRQ